MLRRNSTIAGIMTIAICTSLVNTKVTFATPGTSDQGINLSSDNKSTSPINNEKAVPIIWTADEGTNFDTDKKCTINNIIFTNTGDANNNTACVIGNTLNEGSVVDLPSSIKVAGKDYSVKSVGKRAFFNSNELKGIKISETITAIEEEAFQGCSELASITIPYGVISIKGHAFDDCGKLTNITIPNSVKTIKKGAFDGCGITSITIPNSITSIEEYAFYNCGITSITIPNSVTSIEEGAFYNSGITSITIPDSVTSIGAKAFYGCNGLRSLTIPDSVVSVGEKACGDSNINIIKASDSTMKTLKIPDFNKVYFCDEDDSTLGSGYVKNYMSAAGLVENPTKTGKVFKEWVNTDTTSKSKFDDVRSETKFKAVYEEASVPTAKWDSNKKCTINNITFTDISEGNNYVACVSGNTLSEGSVVKLPNSIEVNGNEYNVTSIGEKAFYGCEGLASITIPDSVKSIGKFAFFNCSKLVSMSIPNGVTSIEEQTFCGCDGLTSMIIPNSVTSIGEHAFDHCGALTNITIPNSVKTIKKGAFYGCGITSITIPNSITSIEEYAFYNCGLTCITIPNSVTSIEEGAFYNSGLTSITIPDFVTSIGAKAFYGCNGLRSLTIPDSVVSVGEKACGDSNINIIKASDSTMKTLKIPDFNKVYFCDEDDSTLGSGYVKNYMPAAGLVENPTKTGKVFKEWINTDTTSKSKFSDVRSETKFKATYEEVAVPEATWNSEKCTINNIIFKKTSDNTASVIGNSLSEDSSVELPKSIKVDGKEYSVTSIGENAFYNLPKLKGITIPNSVTSIGKEAFYNCEFSRLTIPESVTNLDQGAFSGCRDIKEIKLSKGLKVIGNSAFNSCSGLTKLEIPDTVESIGNSAFYGCSDLKDITIPNGVTSIGRYAFYGCMDLTSITLPDSIKSIAEATFYNCGRLKDITLPSGLESIGKNAFYNCNGGDFVTLPDSIQTVEEGAFTDSTLRRIKASKETMNRLDIPGFNKVYFYDEDGTTMRGYGYVQTYMSAEYLAENPTKPGKTFKGWVNKDTSSESTFDTVVNETNFKATYSEDIKAKIEDALDELKVDNNTTEDEIINQVKTSAKVAVTISNFKKEKATVDKNGYVEGTVNAKEMDGSAIDVHFKKDIAKLSNDSSNIKEKIKETLDNMSVNNDTCEEDIINKVTTGAGVTVTISDFYKKKATIDKKGYVEGTVNAEEKDGSKIYVYFKKDIAKLSNDSSNIKEKIKETLDNMSVNNYTCEEDIINKVTTGAGVTVTISDFYKKKATIDKKGYVEGTVNAEEKDGSKIYVYFKKDIAKLSNDSSNIKEKIKETLDNMSVNNDITEDYIVKKVTTGTGVTVTISGFKKEKATNDRDGFIEGTVNAKEKDGSIIDVYFKKLIDKLSNNNNNNNSSKHHHHSSSSKGDSSYKNNSLVSESRIGNGVSVQPTSKEIDLGSMLKTTNDNRVVLTNSWGDKKLRGTVSNVVDKNGDYVGSIITSSEYGIAKLSMGNDNIKDLKYIYQYDATTKLLIKVPETITVDNENITLLVKKDQTYYVAKAPVSDNIVLKEGWNTVNGSTFRVEGTELKTGWVLENNNWYYINDTSKARVENNWNLINNEWYAFNEKGEMKTGWQYNNGNWYLLDAVNGEMKTGWKQYGDNWYNLSSNGTMSTGWKKIDGSWYYFNSNGSMALNTTIDGYVLGSNGSLIS